MTLSKVERAAGDVVCARATDANVGDVRRRRCCGAENCLITSVCVSCSLLVDGLNVTVVRKMHSMVIDV